MGRRNFFKHLSSEVSTNILSRLPIRSVAVSKCLCKPWLNLLESVDFVKSHLSKMETPPALAWLMPMATRRNSSLLRVLEFEDEDEADVEHHILHYHPLTSYIIPHGAGSEEYLSMRGIEAHGLLILHLYINPIKICNPITCEYIELCCPKQYKSFYSLSFGFGLSRISARYKVVCINQDVGFDSCHVYTLGTATWRRVEAGAASGCFFAYHSHIVCNGNLHWILNDSTQICGFDLETECFGIFSAPTEDGVPTTSNGVVDEKLHVLRECLCYSYTFYDRIFIWLMKEYQVEESWTLVYEISIYFDYNFNFDFDWGHMTIHSIKLFKNGDVLMLFGEKCLVDYSNKARTTHKASMLTRATSEDDSVLAMVYPSLFSFKNLGFKNVKSY